MTASKTTQRAPRGLKAPGQRLWRSVVSEYDLSVAEQLLLTEAARVADRLDALASQADGAPLTVRNVKGDQVANPLLTEARQQAIILTRLIASLRLPEDDDETGKRPQRAGAARGAYQPQTLSVVGQ